MLILFDGAFGTLYFEKTGDSSPCESANLHSPEQVIKIHKQYIAAGCNAIKTNTFAAPQLFATEQERYRILEAGYKLALKAAEGTQVQVFCDLGGVDSGESSEDSYLEAAKVFLSLGGTSYLFETLSEYESVLPAIQYIRRNKPDAFIIVSFAALQDGCTRKGKDVARLCCRAAEDGLVDAVGLNCICGPSHMVRLVKAILPRLEGRVMMSAMPNSGYPSTINGRIEYRSAPEYFAQRLGELADCGASILGGCCGTAPEHIKCAAAVLKKENKPTAAFTAAAAGSAEAYSKDSAIKHILDSGRKLIAVELEPPVDANADYLIDAAAKLKAAGADLITLADSPLARTRADSFVIAEKIKREVGIEAMPHLSCRDRNHIGLKGALIAGSIEGMRNVLAVTGDAASHAPECHTGGRGVFTCSSFDLISMISELNATMLCGREYLIAAALNINANNFDTEIKRAIKKKSNGAELLYTQPVYTEAAVKNTITARQATGLPVMAGIMPPAGYKNAVFLSNEVPGVDIPQAVIDELKDKTTQEAFEISACYAMNIIKQLFNSVNGFYLITPLKKTELIIRLIGKIKKLEASVG